MRPMPRNISRQSARQGSPDSFSGSGVRRRLPATAGSCLLLHPCNRGWGTHPALIEAMGQGNLVIANGTPENSEVVGDAGIIYRRNDVDDLCRCLQEVADCPEKFAGLKTAALERARTAYSWRALSTSMSGYSQSWRPDAGDAIPGQPARATKQPPAKAGGLQPRLKVA